MRTNSGQPDYLRYGPYWTAYFPFNGLDHIQISFQASDPVVNGQDQNMLLNKSMKCVVW